MNWIFLGLVVGAVVVGAFTGTMGKVTTAGVDAAGTAVQLALGLIAQMTLWLGFMGVLKESGAMNGLARLLRPVMTRLFPEVPPDHPAMAAMILNLSANILGLDNAATPFGLKAIAELDKLNQKKGVATNAMALFLVINTAGLVALPLTVVGDRASVGSKDPAGIIVPSAIATFISLVVAIFIGKALQRLPIFSIDRYAASGTGTAPELKAPEPEAAPEPKSAPLAVRVAIAVVVGLLVFAFGRYMRTEGPTSELLRRALSDWPLPLAMTAILLVGLDRRVKVYEAFVASAKEGFTIGVMVLPYLVAILVAAGMFRACGALDAATAFIAPLTNAVGFPADALPTALVRPLSGSGARGLSLDAMKAAGPDSPTGYMVSLIRGSSETTFYTLSVYFGAVGVRAGRHTLPACLLSDAVGLVITTVVCHLFFG